MPPRVPDNQRAAIRNGMTRNEIARKHHRFLGAISNTAKKDGLSGAFDLTGTKSATKVKQADNAASRLRLAEREAHRALEEFHSGHMAFSFGDRDNAYAEKILEHLPLSERRNLMIIVAAADKDMAIEKHDHMSSTHYVRRRCGWKNRCCRPVYPPDESRCRTEAVSHDTVCLGCPTT